MYCPWLLLAKVFAEKMESLQVLFCVLAAVCLFSYAQSLECYQCISSGKYEGAACADPIDKSKISPVTCGGNQTSCRKMTQDVNGDFRVVRQCAKEEPRDHCFDRAGTKGIKLKYCACAGEKCNSAHTQIVPTILLVVTFVIAFFNFRS